MTDLYRFFVFDYRLVIPPQQEDSFDFPHTADSKW